METVDIGFDLQDVFQTCSQGGVEVPTGGKSGKPESPRALFLVKKVSRPGVIPGPTVIVRMEENMAATFPLRCILLRPASG